MDVRCRGIETQKEKQSQGNRGEGEAQPIERANKRGTIRRKKDQGKIHCIRHHQRGLDRQKWPVARAKEERPLTITVRHLSMEKGGGADEPCLLSFEGGVK